MMRNINTTLSRTLYVPQTIHSPGTNGTIKIERKRSQGQNKDYAPTYHFFAATIDSYDSDTDEYLVEVLHSGAVLFVRRVDFEPCSDDAWAKRLEVMGRTRIGGI